MAKDMRTYIGQLEEAGELDHVRDPVDVDGEVARRLFASHNRALMFERIQDFPEWKILGQAPANMRHIALAFETSPDHVVNTFAERIDKGLVACRIVPGGPVKDRIIRGNQVDLWKIPVHMAGARDPGRFIASGLCIVKDPDTGIRNMAFHRMQIKGPQKMGFYMVEGRHTWLIYQKYQAMNRPMPMAVMIGHHPMYYFAAAYSGHMDLDELEVAGSLLQTPVDLVKSETIDLEAPADSEIILECEVPPHIREPEGPFSEFPGYYGGGQERPIVHVKAVTMRHDAIYKAVQSSAHTESVYYNGIPQAAAILKDLRSVGNFDVKDVTCNWGGTFNVVIKMTPRFHGEAKLALLAAISSHYLHQKIAVAVDDDVDILDPQDVAWSIATRVNPTRDITIINDVRNHPMDLAIPGIERSNLRIPQRVGSKVIIDATKPPTSEPEERALFERVAPPPSR